MERQRRVKVAETLKSRRVALGLRLEDVAQRSGASASTVSRVERGIVQPAPKVEAGLAEALSLTPEEFHGLWLVEYHRREPGGRSRRKAASA